MYFFLLSLLLVAKAFGQTVDDSRLHLKVLDKVKTVLDEEKEKYEIPGLAVALYINNQEYFLSFGLADTEKRLFVNSDTLFKLASISKVFTSTILSMKTINGSVQLTDSVSKYLHPKNKPLISNDFSRITLLNLATHTASLPRIFPDIPKDSINIQEEVIQYLDKWQAPYPPGSNYFYSNFGFSLLGMALANQNQTNYMEMLNNLILKPLKMDATVSDIPDQLIPRLAVGYNGNNMVEENLSNDLMIPSGGLYSSSADMLKFLKANLGVEGPKNILVSMEYAQKEFFAVGNQLSMGLGWQRFMTSENLLIIDKSGSLPGFSGYIGMTKEKKVGIVILANKDGLDITAIGREILSSLKK